VSFKLIGPQLLARFVRASEDVALFYELGLMGLYVGLSKLVRRRGLISLVEGDYRHLGRTGTSGAKVVLRRLTARSVDLFNANNPPARDHLVQTLKVPRSRIITGWWLAGLPSDQDSIELVISMVDRAPLCQKGVRAACCRPLTSRC
jgi:hypothetical protein